ncbi:MAG: hypothetical protein IJA07_05840 [Agathobacter sp.]|nr:hypothetical protein [Agathobacter sp.]
MENFIEKLKSLDKKVWIGVGIGAAVIILIIVALVIGLGNKKPTGGNTGNSQNGTQNGIHTEGDVSEIWGSEGLGTETLGTEMETEIETEMGTEIEGTEGDSEAQTTPGVGGTTVTQNPDVNGVPQQPTTTKPDGEEILGMGSKDQPYLERPVDMTVTTVAIPSGKALYYSIYLYDTKYLTINDPDAYVIYKNKRYDATNGRVSFKVRKPVPGQPVEFQIGNKGTTDKSFVIKFADAEGSWDNPTPVTSIINQSTYNVTLPAGSDTGYFYTYKAEKTGTIRFYVDGTVPCGLEVQNSSLTDTDSVTFAEEKFVQTDEQGRKYIAMSVTQGEELKIHVCAEPDANNAYPAVTITWEAKYE